MVENKYSLNDILKIIWKNIIVIISFSIIGGVMFGIYAKHRVNTTYIAERSILISHNFENERNANSKVNADISMMPTYKELVKSRTITDKAYHSLPKKLRSSTTAGEFNSSINADFQNNSLVLELKATDSKRNNAISYVNSTAKIAKKELPKLQPGIGSIHVLNAANKGNVISVRHGNVKKHVLIGVALGMIFGMVVSFVISTLRHII